jgi:hypothetical protein
MKKLFIIPFFLIVLPSVMALPQFSGISPLNNTYTFGRETDQFSVDITDDNLNTSSIALYMRVFEPGKDWSSNTTPSCSLIGSVSSCSASITGFGSLAPGGGKYILYWNASNTTGQSSVSENYFITVDRLPPQINFINPINDSYVNGNQTVKINVVDIYSGVNDSSVQYSFDNSTFLSTIYSAGAYLATTTWNTGTYFNNQSVTIYATAKDKITNENQTYINVTIDNEAPTLLINKADNILSGSSNFEVNVTDVYSGIESSTVIYTIGSQSPLMSCTGTIHSFNCTSIFNSASVSDGNQTLTFSASDKAGNIKQNVTSVIVDNSAPTISITSPSGGSYVHETVSISANINDAGKGINVTRLTIDGGAVEFSCSGTTNSKSCTYSWNTATATEGNHVIVVNSTDLLGYSSEKTVSVYIDNNKPNMTINSPSQVYLKGVVVFNISVADSVGLDKSKVRYQFNNTTTTMTCYEISGNKVLVCNSTVNSSVFFDGAYTLKFSAIDGANNEQTQSMNVKIDNDPPKISNVAVSPIVSKTPTNFKISATVIDAGSDVASVKAKITYPDTNSIEVVLKKSTENSWEYSLYSDNQGRHYFDLTATDNNGNSIAVVGTSQFFVGSLSCGNGVCDSNENYCFCSKDCTAPTCKENEIVSCSSGIPTCKEKPVCGNGKCEEGESCSNCEKDCGVCPQVNETGKGVSGILNISILDFSNMSSNTALLIVLAVCVVAVISFLVFRFLIKPKKVYPGFKPKKSLL